MIDSGCNSLLLPLSSTKALSDLLQLFPSKSEESAGGFSWSIHMSKGAKIFCLKRWNFPFYDFTCVPKTPNIYTTLPSSRRDFPQVVQKNLKNFWSRSKKLTFKNWMDIQWWFCYKKLWSDDLLLHQCSPHKKKTDNK